MTNDELDAIEARAKAAGTVRVTGIYGELGKLSGVLREDVPALVAEVRRLRHALGAISLQPCRWTLEGRRRLRAWDARSRDFTPCPGDEDGRCDRCLAIEALEGEAAP